MELIHRKELTDIKVIVVKVGSKILAPQENNEHLQRISALVQNISELYDSGVKVVFVSSGAVAHGRAALSLKEKPSTIEMKQACAGVGQIELLHLYRKKFARYNKNCGQVLLTWDDLRDKKRYLNLRNTLFTMLDNSIIPIINENDSVGVDEIKFGDNDTLAAQISMVTNADLFITLTDINGLYSANPKKDPAATHIPLVEKFTDSLRAMADGDGSDVGTGGMETKIRAAETVCRAGVATIVGDGYDNELLDIINVPKYGTLFLPLRDKMNSKSRYLAFTGTVEGTISVDSGARDAIVKNGKSLLAAGITTVLGDFSEGDSVDISCNKKVFAKGIVNFSSVEIEKILGRQSSEITKLIGAKKFESTVHRNNMVLI
jgi:glutamate 5-kinase